MLLPPLLFNMVQVTPEQHGFAPYGPTYRACFSICILKYYLVRSWLNPQIRWANCKLIHQFSTVQGISTPNLHVVQGSTEPQVLARAIRQEKEIKEFQVEKK